MVGPLEAVLDQVGHHHDGGAPKLAKALDEVEHLLLGGGVEQGFAKAPADDKTEDSVSEVTGDTDASYDAAMAAYRDGRYSEAERRFAEIASQGGAHAPNAALYEVQALRMVSGCPSAAPRFEDVHSRYPGSVGSDAAWQAADCFPHLVNWRERGRTTKT